MKFKQTVIGAVVGLGLGLSTGASAQIPSYDLVRTVEFAIQGVQRTLFMVSEYQKLHSKKEELKVWERRKDNRPEEGAGEGAGEDKPQELPKESPFFAYMSGAFGVPTGEAEEPKEGAEPKEEEGRAQTGSAEFLPDGSDAEYIREKFFYDSDLSKVTEEMKRDVDQRRYSYMENLAKEILNISAGARESISGELETLAASKTTAGGNVNQVQFMAQTKKVMVEQKAADLMFQAKMFELEAAEMLMALNPQRIENPETEEEPTTSETK